VVETLRRYFPTFLSAVGLDPADAGLFEQFLLSHARDVSEPRFLLAQWLKLFATKELGFSSLPYEPTIDEWSKILEGRCLEECLRAGLSGETDEMKRFREAALKHKARTLAQLQYVVQEGAFSSQVEGYSVKVFNEATQERRKLILVLHTRVAI